MKPLILIAALILASSAIATQRDPAQRREFHQQNACPSTGRTSGACPGYQVDHRQPLAAEGADRPSNMQWLSVEQHRAKTRYERATGVYGRRGWR